MKKLLIFLIAIASVGCNVGNAPAGMSEDEAKNWVENMKPEEQIQFIQSSPAPPAEKKAKIDAIRKKYNLPENAGAPSGNQPQIPGR